MSRQSNRDILTRGQKYFEKKKASKQVAEVKFDPESREEYLTGFHKRKLHRQKVAKEFKEEQIAKSRLEERKRIRDERKRQISEKLELIKKQQEIEDDIEEEIEKREEIIANGESASLDSDNDDEWTGFDDEDNEDTTKGILKKKVVFKSIKEANEFLGTDDSEPKDKFEEIETTVTIESLSTTSDEINNGSGGIDLYKSAKLNNVKLEDSEKVLEKSMDRARKYAILSGHEKPKKRKFRYLTASERKNNARQERNKRYKTR